MNAKTTATQDQPAHFVNGIDALESELEGDIDLRGFLGLAEDVPKGSTDIRVNFKVATDARTLDQLRRLALYSPVFNTLTQGTNVTVQVDARP